MPKFFTEKKYISDETALITGENVKHISKVLRKKEGDILTLCDGEGMDYAVRIESIAKESITCSILNAYRCEAEAPVFITLYQGMPKGDKTEQVIQKCTELGVSEIVPVETEFSVARIKKDNKTERYNKIALSAAKQCGRGIVPKVMPPLKFKEAAEQAAASGALNLIPYEREEETSVKKALSGFKGKYINIFIGPEGGFSENEIELAKECGFIPITLGKRILRCETAGMVTIAILLYEIEYGE